jgi:hypothetical protein
MAGVLSRGVEYSSAGARPLVNVYSPKRLRDMLSAAGFARVETTVRHFHPEDTFVTGLLKERVRTFRDQRFLDAVGRRAGWYGVGVGRKYLGPSPSECAHGRALLEST